MHRMMANSGSFSAAITLVGFVFTYPDSLSTQAARNAIDLSVSVCEVVGKGFSVAADAAKIVRDLSIKLNNLAQQRRVEGVASNKDTVMDMIVPEDVVGVLNGTSFTDTQFSMALSTNDVSSTHEGDDLLDQTLFDLALGIDFWSEMNTVWHNPDVYI